MPTPSKDGCRDLALPLSVLTRRSLAYSEIQPPCYISAPGNRGRWPCRKQHHEQLRSLALPAAAPRAAAAAG